MRSGEGKLCFSLGSGNEPHSGAKALCCQSHGGDEHPRLATDLPTGSISLAFSAESHEHHLPRNRRLAGETDWIRARLQLVRTEFPAPSTESITPPSSSIACRNSMVVVSDVSVEPPEYPLLSVRVWSCLFFELSSISIISKTQ
ncbi:hypothetical protein HFX_5022 (plasmid) [Haloferax mediterranei ATCC 33500]|uniref:Uncharacterized protein n=1 Tax=Haloferax mediterranei (strain ATCC 33500 / DSM 1411 / JCM 8866 / NBRC 14739 / NCIMB 2177 / R-4) TaxID=523841 RepID=I3R9E9_HALMT|nr:hypothetical protein HFX_5022 [Haloferax mediterranei ATCC 33500]